MSGRRVLLLVTVPPRPGANTVRDHIEALREHSKHGVAVRQNMFALYGGYLEGLPRAGSWLKGIPGLVDLDQHDVLAIHYSNYIALPSYLDPISRQQIREFTGLKVIFIQDEYRTVNATVEAVRDLGIHVLFTCVPESEIEKVYPEAQLPGVRKVPTLTGFVPENLTRLEVPALRDRRLDVGYRARVLPFWLGELGAEKGHIAPRFLECVRGSGLVCDIANREEDRIYGREWIRFLTRCRATLGVESGASIFDFTGDLQRDVEAYVAQKPGATFAEVHERFLRLHEGKIGLKQISPRAFEAAALRTALILYEGEYSGILESDRHYVELKKDFSNGLEVIERLRDVEGLQRMADRAYKEIALDPRYSYRSFVAEFDRVLDEELAARARPSVGSLSTRGVVDGRSRFGRAAGRRLRHAQSKVAFVAVSAVGTLVYRTVGLAYRAWCVIPRPLRLGLRPVVRRLVGLPLDDRN